MLWSGCPICNNVYLCGSKCYSEFEKEHDERCLEHWVVLRKTAEQKAKRKERNMKKAEEKVKMEQDRMRRSGLRRSTVPEQVRKD